MNPTQLAHLTLLGLMILLVARRLPMFAMTRPVTLGVILSALGIFGAAALLQLPVELMPNVAYGNVTVFIDVRGGMPPPEVERLVTKPVEEAMGSVSHLRNLFSSSKKDRSVVTLEFEPGTNMDLAALEVREKFLRVKHRLPSEIEKPIIARYEESDAPVLIAALTSDRQNPEELRRLVDADLKDRLLRVDGVANVEVGGGRERKIVVDVDRAKLAAMGLPIKRAVAVLEQNNMNLRAGQVANDPTLVMGVRAVGAFRTLEDIRNMTLTVDKNGGRVRLKDIANVQDSFLENESFSRLDAKSAVTVYVQKESMANTVRVAGQVGDVLELFRTRLPKDVELVVITDQRRAILSSVEAVRITLIYGVALVVLVLPLFLAKTAGSKGLAWIFLTLLTVTMVGSWAFRLPLSGTELLAAGVGLLMLGLSLFRPDLRSAAVVALSIPVSVCVTLALMYLEGITINVMSLSGIVLGIGLLVDNAVVVMENYDRLMTENPNGNRKEIMAQAAREMEGPMVGGTLTTVVVFLPFSLLAKQTQLLFAGISFTVTASLFASLFVALTLVPALGALIDPHHFKETRLDEWMKTAWERCKSMVPTGLLNIQKLLPHPALSQEERENLSFPSPLGGRCPEGAVEGPGQLKRKMLFPALSLLFIVAFSILIGTTQKSWLGALSGANAGLAAAAVALGVWKLRRYADHLTQAFHHPKWLLGAAGIVFLAAIATFIKVLPKDLMASSEQNEFVVFVELDTGVRLDISNDIVQEVERTVRDHPKIKHAVKNVSSKVEGWSSKVYVTLKERTERRETTQDVINTLRPDVDKVLEKYEKEYKAFCYFSEPRSGKEVFVELFGRDYDTMAKVALEVASRMGKLPGLSDVKIRYRPGRPQISVIVDPVRAAQFGLDTQEISESLHAQMRGLRATTFYEKSEEVETVVRLEPSQRETLDQMKNLLLSLPTGEQVPLANVAQIEGDLSPSEIWHRNRARMIQVSANLGNTSLESAANAVKEALKQVSFPPEYYADIGGQYEDLVQADKDFWKAMALTLFLVFLVMACQFESYSQPFVIMATVPLSLIGAVAALGIFGATVTLGVSVGLLMLGGIEVNKGIMLIDRIHLIQAANPEGGLTGAIVTAARTRIRPIFMTTATTVLGLIPMALDRSESASLWSPLAITVVGGLISSTVLTLFVVPVLYNSIYKYYNKFDNRSGI
ncbi:MAG: efflux RND transporter permease subunit [Elusimicrobia bacterium]|nr:efflux RND transporter permease subunit [Elusimicrobiota bacterium]